LGEAFVWEKRREEERISGQYGMAKADGLS
jgi:hypothetical protein